VPKGLYPVAIAYGYIRSGAVLHIDLKSLQRATAIIDFLAGYVPASVMEITSLANSNKLTVAYDQDIEEVVELDYDKFFEKAVVCYDEGKLEPNKIKEIYEEEEINELQEKLGDFESYIRSVESGSYPEIERINITYVRQEHRGFARNL
jgi:hypothetical protein